MNTEEHQLRRLEKEEQLNGVTKERKLTSRSTILVSLIGAALGVAVYYGLFVPITDSALPLSYDEFVPRSTTVAPGDVVTFDVKTTKVRDCTVVRTVHTLTDSLGIAHNISDYASSEGVLPIGASVPSTRFIVMPVKPGPAPGIATYMMRTYHICTWLDWATNHPRVVMTPEVPLLIRAGTESLTP